MPGTLLGLVLPPYAHPELAWVDPRPLPAVAAGAAVTYKATGENLELVDAWRVRLTTSAAAGDRLMGARLLDENGLLVYTIPASGTIPANTAGNYLATTATLAAYSASSTNVFFVMPLPPVLLYPGWSIQWDWFFKDVGDQLTIPYIVSTLIPTGEVGPDTSTPLTMTPLIV